MVSPKLIILLLAFTFTIAWACSPAPSAQDQTYDITAAITRNDLTTARRITDKLIATPEAIDTMRIEPLCQLAVAAAQLGEADDDAQQYTAFALKCYETALQRDSALTQEYVAQLPSEQFCVIATLNQLKRSTDLRQQGLEFINEQEEIIQ